MHACRSLALAFALAIGSALALPGCGGGDDSGGDSQNAGIVNFDLLQGGERLEEIDMKISTGTNPGGKIVLERTLDVRSSHSTISVIVQGLPPGDYLVLFTSTATNTGDTCSGQQAFHVDARQTHVVFVTLICGQGVLAVTGNASIDTQIIGRQQCPYLRDVTIAPLEVGVGETLDLSAKISDQSGVLAWASSTDGTIANPSALGTEYTCRTPGPKTISASLTKNGSPCLDSVSAPVLCVGADAGAR